MIGFLKGKIISLRSDYLLIDVAGVGYKVESFAPFRLGLEGAETEVFIHTWVKETEFRLFGFSSELEVALFERLLTVSGVGPKAAMLLVSNYSLGQILQAVELGDASALRVKGVGTKTLAKVVIELKGKLTDIKTSLGAEPAEISANTSASQRPDQPALIDELTEALMSLGFRPADYEAYLPQIDREQAFAAQIKQALKLIRAQAVVQ